MTPIKSRNNYTALLAFFYLLSQGGLLLIPNAIYWDDWSTLFNNDATLIFEIFKELGSMFNIHGHIHANLLKLGPWSYRVFTFILMFASGLLLDSILKKINQLSEIDRFLIVLLFLILPFTIARASLIIFPYTFFYFLFFSGWQLINRSRFGSLALFFLSFNLNSLLFFYIIPISYRYFTVDYLFTGVGFWSRLKYFAAKNIDYILLPFIYFATKIYFFKPYGAYAGYNERYNALQIPGQAFAQLFELSHLSINLALATALIFLVFFVLRLTLKPNQESKNCYRKLLFIVGGFTLIIGLFPYWIVGLTPTFSEWSARHQLLMPLGAALVLVGLCSSSNYNRMGLSIIIGVCLTINVANYKDLFVDWQKQRELLQLISKNAEIRKSNLIIFDDHSKDKNAIGRTYRFYEWNGLMNQSLGTQTRVGLNKSDLPAYLAQKDRSVMYQARFKSADFPADTDQAPIFVEIRNVLAKNTKEKILYSFFPRFTLEVVN